MDWRGQKLSEQLMQYLLLGSAVVSFSTGCFMSSYRTMLLIFVVGVFITFGFTVPDWPYFNRHPLQWAEPNSSTDAPSSRLLKLRQQQQHQGAKKSTKPVGKR